MNINNINNNANGVANQNYEEMKYIVWAATRGCVRQQVYHPELPFPPYPLPPVWPEDMRAMMVLWVARERHMFEMEMAELEHILGLRRQAQLVTLDTAATGAGLDQATPQSEAKMLRLGVALTKGPKIKV
ncbi:hypothetical protein C8R48DRAFT_673814 [Suillus tomentosus]|nr:hypothetical protein C8R48DRAFT_673814 [Suillus tomentosus]